MLGGAIYDAAAYHLPGSIASSLEGADPYAVRDWKDALVERSRARAKDRQPYFGNRPTAIGVNEQDLASLGPSMGFSLVGMGSGLGAGVSTTAALAPVIGPLAPVGGYVAGGAASGVAAYRMATNMFVRDLRDAVDQERTESGLPPISDEEFNSRREGLDPIIKEFGLWEAVPEAVGNVAGFGILKATTKSVIGRAFGKNVLTRLTTKAAGLYGTELPTETITQQGQQNASIEAGLIDEQRRSWASAADLGKSFSEVAPTTILQTTLMGGGTKLGMMLQERVQRGHLTRDQYDLMMELNDRVERGQINPEVAHGAALAALDPAANQPYTLRQYPTNGLLPDFDAGFNRAAADIEKFSADLPKQPYHVGPGEALPPDLPIPTETPFEALPDEETIGAFLDQQINKPISGPAPLMPGLSQPQQEITPQTGAQEADGSYVISGLDPRTIQTDAQAFQYKTEDIDADGANKTLTDVTEWNPAASSILMLWERKDGQLFAVDGHQRVALAKRLDEQNPKLTARVYRETDGFTKEHMRTSAALVNIAQNTGNVLDAAKIMREVQKSGGIAGITPETMDRVLPKSGAITKHAPGLAKLDDTAFQAVVNGVLKPEYAAVVGERYSDPAQQMAAIDALAKTEPETMFQARDILDQMDEAGFQPGQADIFGNTMAESYFKERAKLVEAVARRAKNKKALYGGLVKNEGQITGVGRNRVDVGANRQIVQQQDSLLSQIGVLARSSPEISDVLNSQAQLVGTGQSTIGAATGIVERAISDFIESGGQAPARVEGVPAGRGIDAEGTGAAVEGGGSRAIGQAAPIQETVSEPQASLAAAQAEKSVDKTDLLGQDISQQQALADRERERGEKRSGKPSTETVPVEAGAGELFAGPRPADLFDQPTKTAPNARYIEKREAIYEKGSTQVNLPDRDASKVVAFGKSIPDSEVFVDPEDVTKGREKEPHVTVLYGITENDHIAPAKALEGAGPITFTLGKTKVFEQENYDVLVAEVKSDALPAANKALRDSVEYENDFPDYKPHVTIAYLKKGEGSKYVGRNDLSGITVSSSEVEFSAASGERYAIDTSAPSVTQAEIDKRAAEAAPGLESVAPGPIADFGQKIGGARKDTSSPTGSRGASIKDERPAWRKRYEVSEVVTDKDNPDATGKFSIYDNKTERHVRDGYKDKFYDTAEQAETAIPLYEVARNHSVYQERMAKDGEKGTYGIYRKVSDKKRPLLKGGFDSREDAMRYMVENAVDIIETKMRIDDSIHPALEKVVREGVERRPADQDVNAKDFSDTFSFRGVEFGLWNNSAERQYILNQAYDALLDLAEILDVPPRAISLNGELGIGFGSRGHGLLGAKAHYERDYAAINITKIKGAGSLAHEWLHSFDHYLGRQAGKASGERVKNASGDMVFKAGDKPELDYVSHGFGWKSKERTREELRTAFDRVIDAISKREVEFTEDRSTRERIESKQRTHLNETLDTFRVEMSRDHTNDTYGKKNGPANAAQMAKIDNIIADIKAGNYGEVVTDDNAKVRYSFHEKALELSRLHKEIRGRQGFGRGSDGKLWGIIADIHFAIQSQKEADKFLKEAKEEKVKTKKVRTEYYSEAWKLDQGTVKDYWSTPHELAARAFEAFIYDQMKDLDARNDFLAYEKHNNLPEYRMFNVKPYPEGAERAAINKAWKELFEVVESKETAEGGIILFDRGETAPAKRRAEKGTQTLLTRQLEAAIAKFTGKPVKAGTYTQVDAPKKHEASVKAVARVFGKRVVFFRANAKTSVSFNGAVLPRDAKTIYVNIDSANPFMGVVGHELLHTLRAEHPELYDRLAGIARDRLKTTGFVDFAEILDRQISENRADKRLSDDKMFEEMVANVLGDAFLDPAFVAELRQQDQTFLQRLVDAIVEILRSFQTRMKTRGMGSGRYFNDVDNLISQFQSVLRAETVVAKPKRATVGQPAPAFSRSTDTQADYEQRIDQLLAGEHPNRIGARVLDRSDVLSILGYPDYPVHLAESKVSGGRYLHGLTAEHWKKIPEWVENPVAVFDSDTVPDRLLFIAPETVDGRPIFIIVEPNAEMGQTNTHLLVNAYDKTGRPPPVGRWIDEGLLRYLDQKQSPDFRETSGLQLPGVTLKRQGRGPASGTTAGLQLPGVVHQMRDSQGRKVLSERDLVKYRRQNEAEQEPSFQRSLTPAKRSSTRASEGQTIGGALQSWWDREFRAKGNLPDPVFAAKVATDSAKGAEEVHVEHLLKDFDRAVRAGYGKSFFRLSAAQVENLNDYLAGEGTNVPEAVERALKPMRAYLDRLSTRMITGGLVQGDAVTTVLDNMGHYLTRSYRAFDDPKWARKVPDEVRQAAYDYLLERARESGELGGSLLPMNETETSDKIDGIINNLLEEGTAADHMGAFISQSKLGQKDLSMLIRRKRIAQPIRELLGEYKDPRVNFTRSATKMQHAIANHVLLTKVKKVGMRSFLFEQPTGRYSVLLAPEGSKTLAPLNGLYTTPEIKKAFEEALDPKVLADWYRKLLFLNSSVKYGKTILSVTTMARNFTSASMFAMANGHILTPTVLGDFGNSFSTLWGELRTKRGQREYYLKLKRLGVTLDNPYPGEMIGSIQDAVNTNIVGSTARRSAKKFFGFFTTMYQYGDDFWKIIGFESEKAALIKSGMPLAEAEIESANRIRNTYPTYSLVGKRIKQLRRFPLVGTFVSFPAEIIRTSVNITRTMAADVKAGRKALVARRLVGMAIAAGWAEALTQITMAMFGLDDDDDDAVRKVAAPWSRNSNLAYVGYNEDGYLEYFDLSYLDPYNYIKRPITAALTGGDWRENMVGMGSEGSALRDLLDPFLGPDIAAQALGEVIFNKRLDGGEVYNEDASGLLMSQQIGNHLRKAVQPGTALNIERMIKASKGDVSRYGTQYTWENELWALAGFRRTTMNPAQSLVFKAGDFVRSKHNATNLLNYPLGGQNIISDDDVKDAFDEMMAARQRAYDRVLDTINLVRKIGMDDDEIYSVLDAGGMSKQDVLHLVDGEIPEWKPSKQFLQSAEERATQTAPERRKEKIEKDFEQRIDLVYKLLEEHLESAAK